MKLSEFVPDSGIYLIRCTENGRGYIGQAKSIHTRILSHILSLSNGRHENKNLQLDFDLYGIEAFDVTIIEYCQIDRLSEREKAAIYGWFLERRPIYNSRTKAEYKAVTI